MFAIANENACDEFMDKNDTLMNLEISSFNVRRQGVEVLITDNELTCYEATTL